MHDKQHPQFGVVHKILPWIVAGGALLIYIVTLNHWVTLDSLPYVAKVTGWDWVLPLHAPLFFLVTYPLRWLPEAWQPMALNLFAATCSALSLGLLARSVALLPHDRTHAQRQRERSEFSLLSNSSAWLPPVFAAMVCGLQLTFWENSIAATNESLCVLVFAYVIRCLLEYRIDPRDSWFIRLAFVYGLGATNNWAMIGFFPCILVAMIWIKGASFFQGRFLVRMIIFGLAGLSLYLLLPLAWTVTDSSMVSFGQALKGQLRTQANFLFRPDVRSRVLVVSLTSILPVLIMGIRWPSSFGDTSAAGALISNLMFRVVHVVLLGACLWTVFDQQFSPRALITTKYAVPPTMLTFYYLTALSVGYLSGYVLLVFGEAREKAWKHRGQSSVLANRMLTAAVWLALFCVPAGLLYKNFNIFWKSSAPYLRQFAELCAEELPKNNGIVLSDDLNSLLLLEAQLRVSRPSDQLMLVHSRSLPIPEYLRQLEKRYPHTWPDIIGKDPHGDLIDDVDLLKNLKALSRTNEIYYLHPSFGYYFETFYARPQGLVYHLKLYETNMISPPPITDSEFATNKMFWEKLAPSLKALQEQTQRDSHDAQFLGIFYSRALNEWGVASQNANHTEEAGRFFELASNLNTNNKPARVNLEFNRHLGKMGGKASDSTKNSEDKMGGYRDWESLMAFNGSFDDPEYCSQYGVIFRQQNLFRQAALQFRRVEMLEPTNFIAKLALANVYLDWYLDWKRPVALPLPDLAITELSQIRAQNNNPPLAPEHDLALARAQASAYLAKTNYTQAEQILVKAQEKYPDRPDSLVALARYYAHAKQTTNALSTIDKLLKATPGYVPALIDQATIHFNNHEIEQTLNSLDRILQKDPRNLQALLYKVLVYIDAKETKKALAEVDRVLEIEPENHDGLLHKGVLLIESKNYDEAIKSLDRLLKLQPNDWDALRNRAVAKLQQGRLDEAESDYLKLQRQLPKYHVPYFGLAEIAYQRKDTAAAIRNYEYYLKYAPDSTDEQSAELVKEMKKVSDRLKDLKAAGH